MKKLESLSLQLISIDELNFAYSAEAILSQKKDIPNSFPISFNLNYDWNIEKNAIGIVIDVQYNYPESGIEVLNFKSRINFIVPDLNEYLEIRDSKTDFDMDEMLENALVSVTLSTVRGMLFERTRGTILHHHIIPLQNPNDFLLSKLLKQQASKEIN